MKKTFSGTLFLLVLFSLKVIGAPTFLHIEAIQGEVGAEGHADWIDVWSLHFEMDRTDRGIAPELSDLSIVKRLDKASPLLFQEATTGAPIPVVLIDFFRNGALEPRYLRVRLSDVLISGYSLEQGESDAIEIVSLNFARIELEQTNFTQEQVPIDTTRVYYNLATGQGGSLPDGPPPEGNSAPTISAIPNQSVSVNSSTVVSFTIGDAHTSASFLTLTGDSSNPGLLPLSNIVFGGSGTERTATITPASNIFGSTTVTIRVSDGDLSSSSPFTLTVEQPDGPFISAIGDVVIGEGDSVSVPFTIAHPTVDLDTLTLTASAFDEQLLPTANITFTGTGANRSVELTPAIGMLGETTVTITVGDGLETASSTFLLTVEPVTPPPVIISPDRVEGVAGYPLSISALALSDAGAGSAPIQLTMTALEAQLLVASDVPGGLTPEQIQGNGTAVISISAPLGAINATLAAQAGLIYSRSTSGTGEIVLEASRSGTASATIEIFLFDSRIGLWRALYFSSDDLDNPEKEATVWGDLANPSGDGIVNLLKYALGLSPLETHASADLPGIYLLEEGGQRFFAFTILRRTDDPSLEYAPELSFDLRVWQAGSTLFEEHATLPAGDGLEQVVYRHALSEDGASGQFVRLHVTRSSGGAD